MNNGYELGVKHFQAGNYFVARDVWRDGLSDKDDSLAQAQLYNALGATMDRIGGPSSARLYFEKSLQLALDRNCDSSLIVKCKSNLIAVLTREGRAQEALSLAKGMDFEPSPTPSLEDLYGVSAYCYALVSMEQYDLVIEILRPWMDIVQVEQLGERELERWLNSVHNFASSLHSSGRTEEALKHYRANLAIAPKPQAAREVARIELLQGHVETALHFLDGLYQDFWRFALVTEKAQLARNLELVGIFAHFSGGESLVRRCVEKAEMYYGQTYQWMNWLRMREFRDELKGQTIQVAAADVNEGMWQGLIDDLNLIDGLEAMFPKLYHVARLATAMARRICAHCLPDNQPAQRLIELSGRLAYVGLTVQTSVEQEAVSLLRDRSQNPEISRLGARLLDAYPHAHSVRDVVAGVWGAPANRGCELFSACLTIAFAYVEAIMLEELSHEDALRNLLANPPSGVPANVLQAFNQLFQV